MSLRILSASVVCLAAASLLHGQRLFVQPGASSTAQQIDVLATSPLLSVTGFQAGAGTFQVLTVPDGSKYYAISSATNQSVTEVDSNFLVPKNIAAYSQVPTAAALSPDGSRLAVAAGNLHIFDTATDTEIVPGGINMGPGVSVIDVAFGLDGTTLYSLAVGLGSTQVNEIDIPSHLVTGNVGFHGLANSISVGPNGLIYVTLTNELMDINPANFVVNLNPIPLSALPGRPAFTPDGLYALLPNQTPNTGSSLILVSLANRSVIATAPNLQIAIDSLYVIGVNTVLGFASSTQTAYEITIGNTGTLTVNLYGVGGTSNSATALAISNEVPLGGTSFIDSVFAVVGNAVQQLDPQTGHLKSQSGLPTGFVAGALSYTRNVSTSSLPATLLQYGGGQTVASGAVSAPVVLRVTDGNGLPIAGVTVTFSTNDPTSSVLPASTRTLANGYAVTYLTAGTNNGPIKITASTGSRSVVYEMTVGTSGGSTAGGLTFVSGQGQIIPEGNNTASGLTGSRLSVLVTGNDGNPVANAPVTFLISEGTGTLFLSGGGATTQTVNSDVRGIATVDFLAPTITPSSSDATRGFAQTQVSASAPGTNTLVFTITIVPINAGATIQQIQPQIGTPITGQVNQILPSALQYQIVSNTGYGIPGVGVNLSSQQNDPTQFPSAKCNDPASTGVLSDGTGRITCDLVIGPHVGKTIITANVGYAQNLPSFQLTVTPGAPANVQLVQGNNQSGLGGATLPISLLVKVTDAGGNILAATPVTWAVVTPGTATLSHIIATTDSNGQASAVVTLGNVAGPVQVSATAGSATATFNLAVVVASFGMQKVSGDLQSTVIGTAFSSPLVVEVTGSDSTGLPGAIVNFQVTAGTATLATPTVTTDANGQASTTVTAGATVGPITVTATTATFSVTFTLTARLPGPTNLAVINGASFQAGTGISPGGIAIITGAGILPGVSGLILAHNIVGPMPVTLQGVSITFGGVAAPIYYVMNSGGVEQVAVQVPFEALPPGTTDVTNVNVVVTASSGTPATISVPVKPFAPGIFSTTSGGQTIAVAQRPDGSYVSATNPAQLDENITLYVTGLGAVTPATATGYAGIDGQAVLAPLLIGLNNSGVPLVSASYVQGLTGVYAVTFHVPATTATGSAQPLAVVAYDPAGHFYFSQGISMPVQ